QNFIRGSCVELMSVRRILPQFVCRALLRVIVEIGAKPALGLRDGEAFAGGVVLHLVAADLAQAEIARLRMREIEPADAGTGPHRERLRDLDTGRGLNIKQRPDSSLLGVIGAGRVARRRADAAILLVDQFVVGEVLVAAKAPLHAHALVQAFGERFGEAVGYSLRHDRVVVVVRGAETLAQYVEPDPRGDREGADVVWQTRLPGCDEVDERAAGLIALAVGLLAKEMEASQHL